jgi:mRNA interferase MazF
MKQGEIWFTDLNHMKGGEQAGFRPVVFTSGNLLNENVNIVICCPLTSKVKNYHGNVILIPSKLNGLTENLEVLIFHVRSISKERLTRKIGKINSEELEKIKLCLNDILRY